MGLVFGFTTNWLIKWREIFLANHKALQCKVYLLPIYSTCKRHCVSIGGQYSQMGCTCFDRHMVPRGAVIIRSVRSVVRDEVP